MPFRNVPMYSGLRPGLGRSPEVIKVLLSVGQSHHRTSGGIAARGKNVHAKVTHAFASVPPATDSAIARQIRDDGRISSTVGQGRSPAFNARTNSTTSS